MIRHAPARLAVLAGLLVAAMPQWAAAAPAHGIAMHGEPALPSDFTHLPYADPQAPKGGRVVHGWLGTFDSLNPFLVRGVFPPGLTNTAPGHAGLVYETLLARSNDEAFSLYGLLAETVDLPEDRASVTFMLRPEARFSDGEPVTVDDVVFSLELLREKGRPNHRAYYSRVASIERIGERGVRFVFADGSDRELPLIMGLMPVLPAHAVDPETFDQTTLKPPIGSGPYTIGEVRPGASITYERDPDYWGKDLPINQGLYNFDQIRYEYYRDESAMFESFKKGLIDIRVEDDPGRWTSEYDFPGARDGGVVQDTFETGIPKPMLGLVFNTRRPQFADPRVREALIHLFDFEWANANLFHGAYRRTSSYFEGSELASTGRPADALERDLIAEFPGLVRDDVLEGAYRVPETDGSGRDRTQTRKAIALLREAGYRVVDGRLQNEAGRPFNFEVLVTTRDQERLVLNYANALKRVGIAVSIRQVDTSQFEQRRKTFDFDMIHFTWPSSLSPGNEQNYRWSSRAAEAEGSFNIPGVAEPGIDAAIGALLAAKERETFVSTVRALDRMLVSGFYVLPLYHRPEQWVARWSHIEHPEASALTGHAMETWWRRK